MAGMHMVKYHLLVPVGIFVTLLVVGVSAGTAVFVGLMVGCMSMMLMMMMGAGTAARARGRDDVPKSENDAQR